MEGGYMGKILQVNLTTGEIKDQALDSKLCHQFIGGYGIGARLIYSRQKPRTEPLAPQNILGFLTGPLTGSGAPFGSRFTVVVGKSPLTGTWGDSNCGGSFGPYLKFAGFDGILIEGQSPSPVYLSIKEGFAQLKDARELWGKDTIETEASIKGEFGNETRVVSIGPSGEKRSLISSIMHDNGRAAGRSGVGAVMGSKRLKAIAVMGLAKVPVAGSDELKRLRKECLAGLTGDLATSMRRMGTAGTTAVATRGGGCPVKNWSGVGSRDFPGVDLIDGEHVIATLEKRYGCYQCPIACSGYVKAGKEYDYKAGTKRAEYETLGAFGTLCLNNNLESITMANDVCNRYGLDTISAGATIAFAIECYENGAISSRDTEGIELTWGNHKAIVTMTRKMAKREGFGELLADGVKIASERIGKGSHEYAFHVHGQELPMWDPRFAPSLATAYLSDATPGRHTQAGLAGIEAGWARAGIELPTLDKYQYTGKGQFEVMLRNNTHFLNVTGLCNFSCMFFSPEMARKLLSAVTGWNLTSQDVNTICERIATIRQSINVREGLNPRDFKLPPRIVGHPPLEEGPSAGVMLDSQALTRDFFVAMDWDPETGRPSEKKLRQLDLDDVAGDLWS
jgi:aldehyde:ferredoxin oxidoreductase